MYRQYIKRLIDIAVACIVLFLLLPIGIVVAIVIRTTSGSPVIFSQKRTGLKGKDFVMLKYRTMHRKNSVHDISTKNEMTKAGKIIRSLSLDEVPQLINIVKGEMSFIGPRPWIPEYYEAMNTNQRGRCDVLPGITGLAQVKGRNSLSVHEKINYDLYYVENISMLEDIKVIAMTINAIFEKGSKYIEKSAIHHEIQALMEDGQYAKALTHKQPAIFYSNLQTNTESPERISRRKRSEKPAKESKAKKDDISQSIDDDMNIRLSL